MPRYDVICELCEHEMEIFRSIANRDAPNECPACGAQMVRRIGRMAVIGATPSRPIDLTKQIGRSFDNNADYRAYLAKSGGRETDKASLRPTIDKIQESKDRKAKAAGYRDWKHRSAELRKKIATG